jgi:hypothetical protein
MGIEPPRVDRFGAAEQVTEKVFLLVEIHPSG